MNRAQRRAAAKGDARARAKRMGRRGYDMARHRASRWDAVADYAARSPQRWRIEANAIFRDDQGAEYVESVEAEVGQALLLGELTDTWRDMLREARGGGNPRHHSHDVIRAWPLVTA